MKKRNIIGGNLKLLRLEKKLSQEQLASKLHLLGLNLDRSAISRIESYSREVYDYEVSYFAIALNVSIINFYKDINLQKKV